MTLRDISVAFGFEIDKNSERAAENSIKGIKNLATKLLGSIGIVFSIAGLTNLAQTAADAEALKSQFTQVFGEMEADAKAKLEAISNNTGVMTNRMKGSFTQIAAFSKTTGTTQEEALQIAERAMIAVTDSAAFYDKSIENVTESMRSFLKGNFEQDAALGLSCTETTRNAAANELYGKSFKNLTEAQKQFTLLKMVEDANKTSGALGQAARESDTWTNQLGNLKQSITDLKVAAGQGLLKPAISVLKILISLTQRGTDVIKELTGETGYLTIAYERFHAQIKKIQPTVERMMNILHKGSQKAAETVKRITDAFGGLGNVIKIIGALLASLAILKASSAIGKFVNMIKGIEKATVIARLKVMAIVAAIAVLLLIIEDFVHFLMGNDSVIGSIFDSAGIGAENARQVIFGAWEKIKGFLTGAWKFISSLGMQIFGALSDWWEKNGEHVLETITSIWNSIKGFLISLWGAIVAIAKAVFDGLEAFWEIWGDSIIETFIILWNTLVEAIEPFLNALSALLDFIKNVFTGNWRGAWESLKNAASNAWDGIVIIFKGAVSAIKSIFSPVVDFFRGVFLSIEEGVKSKVESIKNNIVEGFTNAIDWIKDLPKEALQWGADIIDGIAKGIDSAKEYVSNAVEGVADKIKSYLHFSVPDVGPLTDFHSWMPDFMKGLALDIDGNQYLVIDKIKELANMMASLTKSATADVRTIANSTVNNTTSSLTQHVDISNSYYGGSNDTQRNVSKAMNKASEDATAYLARGLEYVRG